MNVWEEIESIRADLTAADQNIAALTARLNRVEIRQREAERGIVRTVSPPPPATKSVEAPERLTPARPASEPPALPPKRPARVSIPPVTPPQAVASVAKPPQPKAPRRFGPPAGMSWEMALGTYWLPRIGVPVIAMAVVYGLTYVAHAFQDAAWMPYARIGAGFALASGLIGIGWKLERKYANYARLLMGGGFGVLYFVLFATWYIPQTRIAPNQGVTLALLALLVGGWGAIAQWRQSRTVALFMTFMGHFTVALSTLTLETPSRAAIGGLFLLGAGSVWFLYRNGWYIVAMTAMAGSYLNQFFWLTQAPAGGQVPQFVGGMVVLAAYLVLFAAAERLTPVPFAAGRHRVRNIYCAVNTGGFLLLALALMRGFDFARPYDYLLYFATAGFGLAMGWSYTLRTDPALAPGAEGRDDAGAPRNTLGDPLSSIYFTKASALIALGFAAWLDGPTVTLSLAIESLVLLYAARQSHRPVGRMLSLGTALLAFLHGMYTWTTGDLPEFGETGYYGYLLVILGTVSIFYLIAELYRVTPWQTFERRPYGGPAIFEALCRDLEMLPLPKGTGPLPSRMALCHLLVGFGAMVLLGNLDKLMTPWNGAATAAALAAGTVALGLWRRAVPMLSGAVLLTGVATLWWLRFLYGPEGDAPNTLLLAGTILLASLVSSEFIRQWAPARLIPFARHGDVQGAWHKNTTLAAGLYASVAVLITGTTVVEQMAPAAGLMVLGALALGGTFYAAAFSGTNLGLYALGLALFAAIPAASNTASPWAAVLGVGLLACAATAVEKRYWGDRPGLFLHRLLPIPYVLYGLVAWYGVWLIDDHLPDKLQAVALTGWAAAFALAMPWLHGRAMAATGTATLIAATLFWLAVERGTPATFAWRMSALGILAAGIAGDRYLAWRKPFVAPWPGRLLIGCAWVVCLAYNREVSGDAWYDAGLGFIALGFLAYAAIVRGGTAALLSLATASVATLPLMLNSASVVGLSALPETPSSGAPAHNVIHYGAFFAYVALIVYWACAERATFITLSRTRYPLQEGHEPLAGFTLTGIPALLGVLCIARIEPLHDFYLTLSWTVWALALFGWALVTHQRWYRYMGLATIGLALGRTFLFDVWRLSGLYRAGAMLALGSALLGVAYGYTRWRASQENGVGRPLSEGDDRDG